MTPRANEGKRKERPILFSGEMVRAILAGKKTQTRRVIRDEWWRCLDPNDEDDRAKAVAYSPYGAPGDTLWVRETLRTGSKGNHEPRKNNVWRYAADNEEVRVNAFCEDVSAMVVWAHHKDGDVCTSIHMPRWASRLTLNIKSVRVERLHEISEEDARAEGVSDEHFDPPDSNAQQGTEIVLADSCRDHFSALWNSINGKSAPWSSNPWVWVVSFERTVPA